MIATYCFMVHISDAGPVTCCIRREAQQNNLQLSPTPFGSFSPIRRLIVEVTGNADDVDKFSVVINRLFSTYSIPGTPFTCSFK